MQMPFYDEVVGTDRRGWATSGLRNTKPPFGPLNLGKTSEPIRLDLSST